MENVGTSTGRDKLNWKESFLRYQTPLYTFAVILISSVGYYITLCPTVEFIDSGELALACKNLGIAHPTGYPLYTIIGKLASMILWGDLIHRVNLLSLFFSSVSTGILFLAVQQFLLGIFKVEQRLYLVAVLVSLFTGFTLIWWSQATSNEVYSLNMLTISLSLWALFKAISVKNKLIFKYLIFSIYFLGLSFTNHMTALYMAFGYLVIVFDIIKNHKPKLRFHFYLILFFIMPLTLYLFLPIRAKFAPFLNWGGVTDPYFLFKHISGWQYRIWMFSDDNFGFTMMIDKLIGYFTIIIKQYGIIGALLGVIGLITCFMKKRVIFFMMIIILLANFIFASNYEIIDIDSYYLSTTMIMTFLIALGIVTLINTIFRRYLKRPAVNIILILLIALLPTYNFITNYYYADKSNKIFPRQAVDDYLRSMQINSLAIIENWDFYSPWLYMRYEENIRPDCVLLDKELMRRSWYIDFIKRYYPDIYKRSKKEMDEFLKEVVPFERNKPYNGTVIDKAYYNMLHSIVRNELKHRRVYTNIISDKKFTSQYPTIPEGYLFRFTEDGFTRYYFRPTIEFAQNVWGDSTVFRDKRITAVLEFYRVAINGHIRYSAHFGELDEEEYYRKQLASLETIITKINQEN